MTALVDAFVAVCRDIWPLVCGAAIWWIGYRIDRAERRLAHSRIGLYTLIETLHDNRHDGDELGKQLRANWPELELIYAKHRRRSDARVERAS